MEYFMVQKIADDNCINIFVHKIYIEQMPFKVIFIESANQSNSCNSTKKSDETKQKRKQENRKHLTTRTSTETTCFKLNKGFDTMLQNLTLPICIICTTILHHSIDGIISKNVAKKNKWQKIFDKFNTISLRYNLKSVFQY